MVTNSETFTAANIDKSVSLSEVHASVPVPFAVSPWRKILAFGGPGLLVAVGYMDPGNWATDIAGGSRYEYKLLFVVLISNWMAILLQALAARLGIVTGRDLAQSCRDNYSRPVAFCLFILCEIAIIACDLAEVIGSAIALQLLFGIPLIWGVCITLLDVLIILLLQHKGFRLIEAFIGSLIVVIAVCFIIEMLWAQPDWRGIAQGFIPTTQFFKDQNMLYLGIGILGATVMPHNLYLHSSIVQTRAIRRTPEGLSEAIKYNFIDSTVALSLAFFINAMILVMGASVFYKAGHTDVAEIQDAYKTLAPLLGTPVASTLFAIALLCSGQNATITGTMAGQIVMEGFINIRMKPWLRRFLTRMIAVVPTIVVIALYGDGKTGQLLILSQVILSLQLPFAVFPLIRLTGNKKLMGEFTSPFWLRTLAWAAGLLIASLNVWLLWQTFRELV